MEITILIISCLILVALGISLFLNYQSNQNSILAIKQLEQSMVALKNDLIYKMQELDASINQKIASSSVDISNLVKDTVRNYTEQITEKTREGNVNLLNNITSVKTVVLESVDAKTKDLLFHTVEAIGETHKKIDSFKVESTQLIQRETSDVSNKIDVLKVESTQLIQKGNNDISNKLDTFLQNQDTKNSALVDEVKKKFNEIIDEIKSPMTID